MKKIKTIYWSILTFLGIGGILQLSLKGNYLRTRGWFRSFRTKQSVDGEGNPLPWCSYPYIQFIENRLNKNLEVFEYGCGNSTRWYASRVRSVKAVDHDQKWVRLIAPQLPSNASVVFRDLVYGGDYSKEVSAEKKKYDVIIVDGRDRNNCIYNSIPYLKEDGIIVYDNTQRAEYQESLLFLAEKGFKRIDFYGLLPISAHENCTTVFYRSNNCLNI